MTTATHYIDWLHAPRAAEGTYQGWLRMRDVEDALPVSYSLAYSDHFGRWQAHMAGSWFGHDVHARRHYVFLEDALADLSELTAAFAARTRMVLR